MLHGPIESFPLHANTRSFPLIHFRVSDQEAGIEEEEDEGVGESEYVYESSV